MFIYSVYAGINAHKGMSLLANEGKQSMQRAKLYPSLYLYRALAEGVSQI